MRFLIARNPDPDSTLPYLLLLPLGGGLVLKARDTWPRTSRVYCHRGEDWPAQPASRLAPSATSDIRVVTGGLLCLLRMEVSFFGAGVGAASLSRKMKSPALTNAVRQSGLSGGYLNDERAVEAQECRPFRRRRSAREGGRLESRYLRLNRAVKERQEEGDEGKVMRGKLDGLVIGARNEGLFAVAARLAAVVFAGLSRHVLLLGRRRLSVTTVARRLLGVLVVVGG